jgi:hypothetical protein
MIEKTRRDIPEGHPIRVLFQQLTERGLSQLNLHDDDTIRYITNLLTEFVQIENMYRIGKEAGQRAQYLFDMLTQAAGEMSPERRRDYYKHIGDLTLFNLGFFLKASPRATERSARPIMQRPAAAPTRSWPSWIPLPCVQRRFTESCPSNSNNV